MAKLEDRRAELLAKIPGWYSGIAHFGAINVAGVAVIVGSLLLLERPTWWHAALVPAFFVFANLFEWWVHRGPLHHPVRGLRSLYERHARSHHIAFIDDSMEIRSHRELRLVLFPPFVFPLLLLMNAPLFALLAWAGGFDLALVFLASSVAYYLVYEWFHTLHHWPRDGWFGRRRVVQRLRSHHQAHHDPRRMIHGNWNVSFPLWDWLLRSTLREPARPTSRVSRGAEAR